MNLFLNTLAENPRLFLSWVLIVTFSICVHEFAHAWTALKCGDDTAARAGHLSLNPMVQMGISSLVILCLFGIAWGAVPVNVANLRKRTDGALVSFAGPLANLILCVLFSLIAVASGHFLPAENPVPGIFVLGSVANGVLFLFNMLPVPMFDGWSVFSLFFPQMQRVGVQESQTMGMIFLALVFITPLGSVIWAWGSSVGMFAIAAWAMILPG